MMRVKIRKMILPGLVLVLILGLAVSLSWLHEIITTASSSRNFTEGYTHFDLDCTAIYNMDPVAVGRALTLKRQFVLKSDESLLNATLDCELFLESRGYTDVWVSQEEKRFPIAYSLVVHKNAWQVEKLIKAIYSPSNIYCIHYDKKSSIEFRSAMEGLAQCLPNVMIATKKEKVIYAGMSRLKADLNCISDLLKSEVQWKYIINLCGQDFPLKTNSELVSELSKLNGRNMVETFRPPDYKVVRFTYQYEVQGKDIPYKEPVFTGRRKEPPPHGIEIFTGSAYFILSREFVEFMNSSAVIKDFLDWSEDTYSPDEHFWGTVVRLPGVPGEIPRSEPDVTALMIKTKLVKWSSLEGRLYPRCTGIHVREICIFAVGELRWLLTYGHWFANKFDPNVDPFILQCLEESLQKQKQKIPVSFTYWLLT